jgi:glucokinase
MMTLSIGVVVAQSATRFSAVAADISSRRARRRHEETPLGPDAATATILRLVQDIVRDIQPDSGASESPPVALCCALEADLDADRDHVLSLPYAPGWDNANFRDLLARRLSTPVSLATVTEAAAIAEYERGAGAGRRSMLFILPARGVTACLIEHGAIIRGAHGLAGNLDHWPVRDDGPRCACGGRGHVATIASAQSIVRAMIGRASDSDESTAAMLRASGGRAEAMSAGQVVELAAEGDPAAQSVIEDAADALATALIPLSLMLDPGIIVVGGPLALAGPYYFSALNQRLRKRMAGAVQPPQAIPGHLEPLAAPIGAAILASRLHACPS